MIDWWIGGALGPSGALVWTAPDWVVVVAAGTALVAWVASLAGRRAAVARLAEAALWSGALAGVVVALARPVWVEEQGRTEPGRVAVLVDASASMGVREGGGSRGEQATALAASLEGKGVDVFHFGANLSAGLPDSFALPDTDFDGALRALSDRFAGEKLAGVVIISDGLDRGLLRQHWRAGENPVPPQLPGPLTVFQVGTASDLRDLAVQSVDAGGYAYVHAPFRLHATLRGVGFGGRTVRVQLSKEGAVVHTKDVVLDGDGKGEATFEVTPDKAGRFAYLIEVPDYEDDAVPSNNSMPVVVRVVRDKIRVLQVAGAPSWDVKFLRRFLKGDPSVDLVSFFILRTRRDLARGWSQDELSLIEFPYQQLFSEDLKTFDLVVFQNFDYEPYFEGGNQSQLLQNLKDFVVKDGHALVMVGGDRSFDLGKYGGTPLEDVLPVTISATATPADEVPFRPVLTTAGARHPVTRLVSDPAENATWWARTFPLDGTNTGLDIRPGADVLLGHPSLKTASGKPLPILSVREAGAGRSMALTVDASWRWSLFEAAEGRGNQAYLRFWKNAMRWLIADPSTARITVDTARENVSLGDEVRIVVGARGTDFGPLEGAHAVVTVTSGDQTIKLEGNTGADGSAILTFKPERRGAHRVEAKVTVGETTLGADATVFAVTNRDPELDEVAPDDGFLKWLAARGGGTFYGAGEHGPIARDESAGRTVWDRREVALWRSPGLIGLIVLLAGSAWIVRRRAGMR